MNLSKPATSLVQTEKLQVAAFRYPLLQDVVDGLRSTTISVIDFPEIKSSPKLPRIDIAASDMSAVGQTCLERMRLEAERRFCENDSEEVNGSDVLMTEKDGLPTLLDPRTCSCTHMINRTGVDIPALRKDVREEYVRWGLRAHAYRTGSDTEDESEDESDVGALPKAGLQVADGVLSDDDDEEEVVVSAPRSAGAASKSHKKTKEDKKSAMLEEVESKLRTDWRRHWKAYHEQVAKIPWRTVPGVVVPKDERELIWKDLWGADVGVVMREHFFKVDPDGSKFGHLPKMALASKGMMGALMAASFCERINSCANLVEQPPLHR